MTDTYELTQLDSHSFEHLVNYLALKVLGKGVTGFAQGADGGRDGFLQGEAPYPTMTERWSGVWYIQSKFHKPHLSKDPQAWLIKEIKKELAAFENSESRLPPDIWIIATNIEPSGIPNTGAYDAIKSLVFDCFGEDVKFDIWGGRRILDFLAEDPTAASHYGHFLTPGNVLTAMYNQMGEATAQVKPIINHLILDQFNDQIYTKLEQAGSSGVRPKIHELFVDLPTENKFIGDELNVMETLVATSANAHRPTVWHSYGDGWRDWSNIPRRARAILLKGGPGQGKSTAGQFFSQIQRAALLLDPSAPLVLPATSDVAKEFLAVAERLGFKPTNPRIPISIELKDYASWYGSRSSSEAKGVLSYLCEKISQKIDQKVEGGTLKKAFSTRSWFLGFDGLDEVPNDVKDEVANEIIRLTNLILPELDADILVLCTTRPQGYSGQFEHLNAATLDLVPLPADVAMRCAEGVIKFGRSDSESEAAVHVLTAAMESAQVRELMTTPLQSHIMAVVVRDGGRPPEKRWELFDNFYDVMKKRESLKNFPDVRISKLLRDNSILLKAIHARLGIALHASAEISDGADTTLGREQFCHLARQTTERYVEENVDDLVETLMEATTERLVFVNTPESNETVRFDIRQLQEFFAGEFIYSNVEPSQLRSRLEVIAADSHWREVMHFVVSALIVTMRPTELAIALEVICGIDDSDASHAIRVFKRRLGVGAILTLRLLNEGVLEQDRTIRLKFKDALTPLYAMTESEVISDMVSLNHQHTLSWLLNCMADALFEYSEPEQIGAAIVLARKLPDTHVRKSEIKSKIFGSSAGYINRIYRSLLSDHYSMYTSSEGFSISHWFLEGTLQLLVSENLDSKIEFWVIVRILRRTKAVEQVASSIGLSDLELKLLMLLLEGADTSKYNKQISSNLDGITIARYEHDWKTKTIPESIKFEIDFFSTKSPVLKLMLDTIRFAKSQQLQDLCSVLSAMDLIGVGDMFFPEYIQALLPVSFDVELGGLVLKGQLEFFKSITQEEFDFLLMEGTLNGFSLPSAFDILEVGNIDSVEKLEIVSKYHPLIALSIWLASDQFNEPPYKFRSPECLDFILNLVVRHPRVIVYQFSSWGKIFDSLPDFSEKIRPILKDLPLNGHVSYHVRHAKPFLLKLPEEINFLTLIARMFISSERRADIEDAEADVHSLLERYGLNNEILVGFFMDEKLNIIHRAAAFCCYICQAADERSDIIDSFFSLNMQSLVLLFCESELPTWYVGCLVFSLGFFDHNKSEVMQLVGQILYLYREDYWSRAMIQSLLSNWRERSSAPVHSRAILETWLSE
ncbi:NACHT domain-containing protein [Pseudomonas sp. NPDC089530]|uniref:NACHT domain-containing protein n=1 Tax=Pseudomonas sp. NPDC089530 TaxID=3390651 RepID=UPI003D04E6E8